MACYREGGCGPYENRPCSECPASKPEYKECTIDVACNEVLAEIRKAGMKEAWDIAKRIAMPEKDGGLKIYELKAIFGSITVAEIFAEYSVEEAKILIENYSLGAYDVGSIVRNPDGSVGVIIKRFRRRNGSYSYSILWSDFSVGTYEHDEFQPEEKKIDVASFQEQIKL